jgi:hypothetical protein
MEGLIQSKQAWIEGERRVYLQQLGASQYAQGLQGSSFAGGLGQAAFGNSACGGIGMLGLLNAYQTPQQRKLARAQEIAAEVRARKPEMQVRRITRVAP